MTGPPGLPFLLWTVFVLFVTIVGGTALLIAGGVAAFLTPVWAAKTVAERADG